MNQKVSRKQMILESLAAELERSPGERITTAALARAVGVSEAALYRHFASKAKMFEGLIGFAEESVFARINQILEGERETRARCAKLLYLLLAFSERNPGITRVLLGDALVGETERLHLRVEQFFARLETQLRQILRESRLRDDVVCVDAEGGAALMLSLIEGRMHQFLRTRFKTSPTLGWEQQWAILERALFQAAA
ncbi:MAG: nucleoid occlusion factor SlmA [Sedimenticola sp.]|uniref:Nucleoid occlusion factor SlmA n=1 Tax=Sedimenticola thiotaurini TaxID=1543721 RepID=A0A558DFZ5_9GAMM|nr:nucleoid occlusion factor SlmA [Sedimenticola sp.]TVT59951.1 MAG: nucleoid occlusion factor SlmA [Sedimenticola thiotaurini]MCW8883281.1 nucleoid occlusion factor SlmA [Sedimenticola sp.]MCW8920288.1 nucleoid occlusion factor SlmA [Sedimenticola sp.]MCW8946755.1 nucleoid occlusion factor SlmA [Sedimenticola sp.]